MSIAVRAEGLRHTYETATGPLSVLDDVDLCIAEGEHVSVVGRSGSGKSTLLALIGGLDRPQRGTLDVLGRPIGGLTGDELARFRSTEVGFVFQHFGLLDTLTAEENVALAAAIAGVKPVERRRRSEDLLDLVGLADRRHHDPQALSGGERQRVAIARALINEPRLVLADEPTGNLDDAAAEVVSDLIGSLPATLGTTVVVVTHDHALAATGDRIVRLIGGRVE